MGSLTNGESPHRPGRHLLQIPGPTNVPGDVLAALARPTIDHRGPEFRALVETVLPRLGAVFRTSHPVVVLPSSGTGAWEAALVNTLSPGERVLMYETGYFAALWADLARRLGLQPVVLEGDWRGGARAERIGEALAADGAGDIRAVCVVHNETSTGAVSDIAAVRAAIDAAGHPALLMADTISSLASIDYRHDEWGVDVAVGASQKGLMLPPGLGFNAVSARARDAHARAKLPRSYWDWTAILEANAAGAYPYTPATNMIAALGRALEMILEHEGLDACLARHGRLAAATRAAVTHWGFELVCRDAAERSNSLTAVWMPDGGADALRAAVLDRYDVALGNGLGRFADRVFRIGHLGSLNETMLIGTLGAVELGLVGLGHPVRRGGVDAALTVLADGCGQRRSDMT